MYTVNTCACVCVCARAMGKQHTMHEMVLAPGPRIQDSGPCYCPWPILPSGDSPTYPKFKAYKLVTHCPLAGLGGHTGFTGVCVLTCVYM